MPQHELVVPVQCSQCGERFYGPIEALGIADDPRNVRVTPRFEKFLSDTFNHIKDKHPEHFEQCINRREELMGWGMLSLFIATNNQRVERQRDYYRWRLHQMTLSPIAHELEGDAIEQRAKLSAAEFIAAEFTTERLEKIFAHADMSKFEGIDKLKTEIIAFVDELRADLAEHIDQALEELIEILVEPDKYDDPTAKQTPKIASEAPN